MARDVIQDGFTDTLPVFAQFEGVTEAGNYQPLPGDWALATADIVSSTGAIEAGRYKVVNMAGASVIAAVLNALDRRDLPFVFGGDGATVAFPAGSRGRVEEALAAVQTWAAEDLDLAMRAAVVPVADIRAQGLDVRVARYKAADGVFFAMLTGGGSSWAEAQMKAGRYRVEPAAPGARPDLTGLSCRWNPVRARHGEIVSIIAAPHENADPDAFRALVSELLAIVAQEERGGHPLPEGGPSAPPSGSGIALEVKARAAREGRLPALLNILVQGVLSFVGRTFNRKMGPFDARQYLRDVTRNSDFRKFDDGLKMTVDIDAAVFARLQSRLERAEAERVCRFGLHRQSSALVTCIVTDPMRRDHVHFLDGAAGGYAAAAANLKRKAA
jgi:hypothetical protein